MKMIAGYEARRSLPRQLKMTHVKFAILNSHVTVTYLRFIKNTYFYAVKEKK